MRWSDDFEPFGNRSGVLAPMGVTPIAAEAPPPPAHAAAPAARGVEDRVAALERLSPVTQVVEGPRDDLPGGRGVRVRIGKLSDGSYGVERWTQAGQRQLPTWSNA